MKNDCHESYNIKYVRYKKCVIDIHLNCLKGFYYKIYIKRAWIFNIFITHHVKIICFLKNILIVKQKKLNLGT